MALTRTRKVFTVPPGVPLVDAVAAKVLRRHGGDPLALTAVTLLLPTRRACLAIREAFLSRAGGDALLLPRIVPLGDVDPDEIDPDDPLGWAADDDLPPAISPLRRRLLLARMVAARGGREPMPFDQALRLAAELARFLDEVQTERISLAALAGLVPEDYAEHWQKTLDFLAIVTAAWPKVLAEQGVVDPAARRDATLAALAHRWAAAPPRAPVIAAGSTGSIPATADLLAVIARLPGGAVILPGLDRDADDATWEAIDETHPQFGLKRLIAHLGIDRAQVRPWPIAAGIARTPPARAAFLATALAPAETTDAWRRLPPPATEALAGLARIDCANPREEAEVVALELRRALETPGRTAALVTRDRALARRVAAALGRWGLAIDDSAGRPLAETPPGTYLRLVAGMVAPDAGPVAVLAALKHPLATGGERPGVFRARVRALERAALRGVRPGDGLAGIAAALPAAARFAWFARLCERARPFAEALAGDTPLAEIAAAHAAFAEALAASAEESGAARLWRGEAGEAAAALFAEIIEAADGIAALAGTHYPATLDVLLGASVVRPRYGGHPRLHIWGPLEARLQRPDVIILGGLNEASWPPEPAADPWLSRPMRAALGLPAPERRIGLAAHDFLHCASAPRALMTRAAKAEGAPTVPSRWLARIEALLGAAERAGGLAESALLGWARGLDHVVEAHPLAPPEPRPPLSARPRRLSVTQIETWMRDPYAIYARHILNLAALDPVDADPGAADRGTLVHEALERFVAAHPERLPADAEGRLIAIGREVFAPLIERPEVAAFWCPRFRRIAGWFLARERERRAGLDHVDSEVTGDLAVAAPAGDFLLRARADRIERRPDGLVIIDYKTGQVPSRKDVAAGLAPQLPLEAAIAAAGGFTGVPPGVVEELAFWRMTGGEPVGEIVTLKEPEGLAAAALEGLETLVAAFDDAATPYHAEPDPGARPRFSDYAHLARIKEWADRDDGNDA